jgi:hypothetical protein
MTVTTHKCFDCGEVCRKVRVTPKRFDDGRIRCDNCRPLHRARRIAYWKEYKTHYELTRDNRGGSSFTQATEEIAA